MLFWPLYNKHLIVYIVLYVKLIVGSLGILIFCYYILINLTVEAHKVKFLPWNFMELHCLGTFFMVSTRVLSLPVLNLALVWSRTVFCNISHVEPIVVAAWGTIPKVSTAVTMALIDCSNMPSLENVYKEWVIVDVYGSISSNNFETSLTLRTLV